MDRKIRDYIVVDVDTGHTQLVKGSHKLSKNLAAWELVSDDTSEVVLYSSLLAHRFQAIRDKVGKAIKINSGHRTITTNEFHDGSTLSKHLFGRALDLDIPVGYSVDKFADLCESVLGYNSGIGLYKGHVHIDNGPHFRKDWR